MAWLEEQTFPPDKELETYRLAIPAIVEDFAQLQIALRDEKTVCEFWKQACDRSLQLADNYASVANALRDKLKRACQLALAHLNENSSQQLERAACAELNAMLTEAEST